MRSHSSPASGAANPLVRSGFTVIEILAVLTIASFSIGLVVPALVESVGARKSLATVEELTELLKQARYRAVMEGQPIGVSADRETSDVMAPRLGRTWHIPAGYRLEFPLLKGEMERKRKWLLFLPGGIAHGDTARLCRNEGSCWEISVDPLGRIQAVRKETAHVGGPPS